MIYPLLRWTESEVWQFLKENDLPINPCYKYGGRVGCMFCPFSKKKQIEFYEQQFPLFKRNLIKSLEIYLKNSSLKKEFSTPEEYFEWWKNKENIKTYKAKKQQLEMEF